MVALWLRWGRAKVNCMCNRYRASYRPPLDGNVRPIKSLLVDDPEIPDVFPRSQGPIIRRAIDDPGYSREALMAQWGLIPWFAKSRVLKFSTNNARSEEVATKASYKQPWSRGQRCIIPAEWFDEPCWETGRNAWWRFRRADGAPWALAGLWSRWVDPATAEVVESYTMLTINADHHPLMSRMHKPDPTLPVDQQDKRSVIAIEAQDIDRWLAGTVQDAQRFLKVPPVEVFEAGAV